jgi:cyclopropane fatty-acyl-phospholipid synthase-like methyltransferase
MKKYSGVTSAQVRDYYDVNTSRFIRYGCSPDAGAIHRKLWADCVKNDHEALLYINQLLAESFQLSRTSSAERNRILDLGCGIGGTAIWLASDFNVEITGVTISANQVKEAQNRTRRANLDGRCFFHVADFQDLDLADTWDAVSAIEAFSHATSHHAFLRTAARHLETSSRLILIDDFLVDNLPGASEHDTERSYWLQRFRDGWRLPSLIPISDLLDSAKRTGFKLIRSRNLTPLIRFPRRFQSTLLRQLARLSLSGHYWASLKGGIALQVCLQRGWVEYGMLEFERE